MLTSLILGIMSVHAQVTIGSSADPDPSAVLELNSDNKGFLLPRISLKNNTDKTVITNPADGLMVYVDGSGGLEAGVYVWYQDRWNCGSKCLSRILFHHGRRSTTEESANSHHSHFERRVTLCGAYKYKLLI